MKKLINLAKALDFTTELEYFNYMVNSYINGNFSQCRKLFNDMTKEDKKTFIKYLDTQRDESQQYDEIYTFYFNLL